MARGTVLLDWSRSAFKVYCDHSSFSSQRGFSASRYLSKQKSETHDQTNQGSTTSNNSSSTHQSYNRKSYERKRKDYQNGFSHNHDNDARMFSFMANPSTTHYQRLNIDPSANLDTIKSAYYTLSKQYHPDIVGKDDRAIDNFRLITDAYDTLSNPETKAEYDKQIRPEMESSLDQTYTWKPQGYRNPNQEAIYRMREASRIFQTKQDEALAREKERNPNKFRSGVFRHDLNNTQQDRQRLENLLNSMNEIRARSSSLYWKPDGNEFYRVHLYGSLLRKQQDIRDHDHASHGSSEEVLWASLIALVGAIALCALTAVSVMYNIDLATYLDSKLEKSSPLVVDDKGKD